MYVIFKSPSNKTTRKAVHSRQHSVIELQKEKERASGLEFFMKGSVL